MNLFDMMRSAGGGDAASALASQFGLTPEQVTKAVEAFAPAFSAGLKRATLPQWLGSKRLGSKRLGPKWLDREQP